MAAHAMKAMEPATPEGRGPQWWFACVGVHRAAHPGPREAGRSRHYKKGHGRRSSTGLFRPTRQSKFVSRASPLRTIVCGPARAFPGAGYAIGPLGGVLQMGQVLLQSVLALAVLGGLPMGARAASGVAGNSYAMTIFTSFGTQFEDCWAFDDAGNLTINDLGTELYTVNFSMTKYFSAVESAALAQSYGGGIGFAGRSTGKKLTIIGSDYAHDGYYGTGTVTGSCTAARRNPPAATNPYRR